MEKEEIIKEFEKVFNKYINVLKKAEIVDVDFINEQIKAIKQAMFLISYVESEGVEDE